MAKSTFLSFSTTAGDNTDIDGIGTQGTNAVSNFDNAFRTIMAILRRDLDNGTVFVTKSAGYTAVAGDNNSFYEFTATATLALTAAATLAADWHMMVFANGGAVTVDPDAAELINGASTLTVSDGSAAYIISTGTAFKAVVIPGLASKNTFTKTQVWSKGADIASASALTPGTDGNYFDVTGTTTITSIATVGVGAVIKLHFDAALTLTHHATDLILPGGANITTAAGDEAEFVEYASGDWRCVNYQSAAIQGILHVRDEKAAGTAAGSSVAGAQVRVLNTVVTNTIPGASLSANVITLPAGTYDVQARAPAFTANAHQAWLRVSGGGAALMDGSSEYAVAVGSGYGCSIISGRLTLAASTNIEMAHYISNAQAANGLGTSPSSGRPSIYAEAIFRKVNP